MPKPVIEGLDAGIAPVVELLRRHGIETFESCQGGKGHAFFEPTIRFSGTRSKGYHAVTMLMEHGLPVADLRRYWTVIDGELTGPEWEVTFASMPLARELAQTRGLADALAVSLPD